MKDTIIEVLMILGLILLILAVLASVGATICAYVMYGGKPIDEIPAWALTFMLGGR